jgi:hypothetical protein
VNDAGAETGSASFFYFNSHSEKNIIAFHFSLFPVGKNLATLKRALRHTSTQSAPLRSR